MSPKHRSEAMRSPPPTLGKGQTRLPLTLRRLTTERSAKIILFMLLFAMAIRISADTDVWWHLHLGKQIVESGQVVYEDSASFTRAGVIHQNHSGLAQIVLYLAWRAAGNVGLSLYVAIIAVLGMAFVYRAGAGSVYMQSFVLVVGATTAAVFWSPRPQMVSFLSAAILMCLLMDLKRGRAQHLWVVLPLMWLWSNAHAGYVFGYLLLVAFIAGELVNRFTNAGERVAAGCQVRRLVWLTIASVPLLVLNPLGFGVYTAPFQTLALPGLRRYIAEWQPPDFSQPITWAFPLLVALVLVAMRASRRRLDSTECLWLIATGMLALTAARNLSLFAVAAVPVATAHLDQALRRLGWSLPHRDFESPGRLLLNLLLVGLVASGLALRLRYVTTEEVVKDVLSSQLPVAAVEHLAATGVNGNLFNSYNWGGYLIFRLPQVPVFIDGRSDLYAGFLDDYYHIATAGTGWEEQLDRWRIQTALIETGGQLAKALTASDAWTSSYQDPLASIFVRES